MVIIMSTGKYLVTSRLPWFHTEVFTDRKPLYQQLERARNSRVIAFVTGDRQGLETQIADDIYHHFVNHLDKIGVVPRISVFLYTRGGITSAAWSLTNLLRSFCEELEFIIPSKAHSGGTLMALGGRTIVMTKQATLGPIDPAVNNPLNPQISGGLPGQKAQVSVESIKGYFELAKNELGITQESNLTQVFTNLSAPGVVHPLVLGEVYRIRSQIQMQARKLLSDQIPDSHKVDEIVKFLCSESGSHDYTIHRREAKSLGLNVEIPSVELYQLIKAIYDDMAAELELPARYDANVFLGSRPQMDYSFHRGLVDTLSAGTTIYLSEGQLSRRTIQIPPNPPQVTLHDERRFDGWRHHTI